MSERVEKMETVESQPLETGSEEAIARTQARVEDIIARLVERYTATDGRPWIIGFSGGKDSTLLLHCVYAAIARTAPRRRNRPVWVLSSNTLVESPQVLAFLRRQLSEIADAARSDGLPIELHLVEPDLNDTFFVKVIGYGYPAPNKWFRWCTDRLKIQPANRFIQERTAAGSEVVLLLGTRYDESLTRARSVRRHEGEWELNPHSSLRGAWVFAPIKALRTEEVWEFLTTMKPPWGGSHLPLRNMYRDANAGDCPLVVDETTAPCGNSRFGCWTCTVVERDRSMEGFVASGHEQYKELLGFRDRLQYLRNDESSREPFRRNGQDGLGPLKMSVRRQLLEDLLDLQDRLGEELISSPEVAEIRKIWLADNTSDLFDTPSS
jgi:DNA sulfur modification protein DndC